MLSLSVALVAKSLDGDVGTQAKEEKNKNCRTYIKKCDKRDRSSNCSGNPHIPGNRPKHGARLGEAPLRGPVSLIGSIDRRPVGSKPIWLNLCTNHIVIRPRSSRPYVSGTT